MHCKATNERKIPMAPILTPIRINAETQNQLSLRCKRLYATLFAGWWSRVIKGGQFWNWAKIMWRISDPNSATDSYSVQEKAELPLIHTQQQHIMMIFGWYLEYRKGKWVILGKEEMGMNKESIDCFNYPRLLCCENLRYKIEKRLRAVLF